VTAYEPGPSSRRSGVGLRGEPCGGVRVGDTSRVPSFLRRRPPSRGGVAGRSVGRARSSARRRVSVI
jgi:hypothetical protein